MFIVYGAKMVLGKRILFKIVGEAAKKSYFLSGRVTKRGGGAKGLSGRATEKITFFLRLPLPVMISRFLGH